MDNSYEKLNIEELSTTFFIDIYEIINDELYVLGNITTNQPGEEVEVTINNEKIKTKNIYFPQKNQFNDDSIHNYSIEFKYQLSTSKIYKIEFKSKKQSKKLNIDFSKHCNFSKIGGYAKTKKFLSSLRDNEIIIKRKTTLNWLKQELKFAFRMLKNPSKKIVTVFPFRLAYLLGYPFLKNKHIWFFMDRPEIADDNGMHIFKYAVDKDPEIKKYFILDKNSKDYPEMKKIGAVLPFQSVKHRYLELFAENIVTSHPDNQIIYPFWGSFEYFAGLLKTNTIFLQHGIIKDDISEWLNKSEINLSLFVTSANKEYESVFNHNYNYSPNVVKLLGLPRYDNLKNETNKKQILIMPSWRHYLSDKSDEEIAQTEFFKRFNSLINNEEMINMAKKYDYEIIFKPHPNIYKFINLFNKNSYVKIAPKDTKYQTLFNNGSLLITDYSSVAFDFSYLHKPILYYQYGNDYHFDVEEGYFKYESMGFGEVCRSEDALVKNIIYYIENDCKMKDEYSKRVDDFFLYTDNNNCMRVYNAIKDLPLKD